MPLENIEQLTPLANSQPEVAAKNIENANIFRMDPGNYKQFKPELDLEAENYLKPTETTKAVKGYMAQSDEHTSLALPDNDHLSYVERQANLISDYVFNRPTADQKVIDLSNKKMNSPDKFTDDDQIALDNLNFERSELAKRNYGLDGPIEQLPAKVAGALSGLVRDAGKSISEGADIATKFRPKSLGGLAVDVGLGFVKQGYDSLAGSTYNELSNLTDEQGNAKNIDETTKKHIAMGVGVAGMAIQTAVGAGVAKATPFLGKFLYPTFAKQIVENPANAAIMKTLMGIGEQVAVGATGGLATEATKIVSEEMGKTYDGTEASFINGLINAGTKIKEYGPRLAESAAVGGLTTGAIGTATGVAGFKATKGQFQTMSDFIHETRAGQARDVTPAAPKQLTAGGEPGSFVQPEPPPLPPGKSPVDQSVKVLQFRTAMDNIDKALGQTNMAKIAPTQLADVTQKIFESTGIKKIWLAAQDLKFFANTPEKAAKVKSLIEGTNADDLNAPVSLMPHKFLELVKEYPDAMEHMRLDPEGPSPMTAEKYLQHLSDAEEVRKKILSEEGVNPVAEKTVKKEIESAKAPVTEFGKLVDWHTGDEILQTEEDYMSQGTFSKAIESVIPKKEVERFDAAQRRARIDVHNAIQESAQHEVEQVRDIATEQALETQREIEIERIANDPNFALVDKFRTFNRQGKGKSIYAIDPKKVPDDLLNFTDNARLKEHRVFAKGGLSPQEAAILLGVHDGRTLLETLSRTPTREQIIEARTQFRAADLEAQARDSVDLDQTNLAKAYNNSAKLHLEEMKFMKDKEWPATKSGIKRIALPLPKIEELEVKAKAIVAHTKVGDLNVNQYKIGERRSQREAVNNILKNEVEMAFMNKEKAALNVELQKATSIAIARVNRATRFVTKLEKKDVQQIIKDAGPRFEKAYNEIVDFFNLVPGKKGLSIEGSYAKYVQHMYENGRGDFALDPNFTDIRQNANEMTTEGYLSVVNRLRALLHAAETENKLYGQVDKAQTLQTQEALVSKSVGFLENHIAYDPMRLPNIQDKTPTEKIISMFNTPFAAITNLEFVAKELDQEENAGFFQELLIHQLKGDGKYDKISGYSAVQEYSKELKKFVEGHIEKYGKADFHKLDSKFIDIPEFKDSAALRNGKLTKAELITLWSYGGDPDGFVKRGKNMGVSNEIIQKVLDRELEERDIVLGQKMLVDGYKAYRQAITRLQKETSAQEVTFIEGIPNYHRGKAYDGGYLPNKHKIDYDEKAAKASLQMLEDKAAAFYGTKDNEYAARQYGAEMTEEGRKNYLKEREGSDTPLDLSFKRALRGHEEVIHDIAYRKALIDYFKIMKDPQFKKAFIAVTGEEKYKVALNTGTEIANRVDIQNANYFSDTGRFIKDMFGAMQSNFSVGVLSMNPTSVLTQFSSVPLLTQNMGVSGAKHIAFTAGMLADHPDLYSSFYDRAVELDPTIGHFVEGLQNKLVSTIYDLAPSRGFLTGTKYGSIAKVAHKWSVDTGMMPMAVVDVQMKMIAALSAESQFRSGDVKAYPIERLQKMTPKEIDNAAQAYARQISRTSLTHAADEDKAEIQRNMLGGLFTNYWNDARNVINTQMSQGRKTRWYTGDSYERLRDGDYVGAKKSIKVAAAATLSIFLGTLASRMIYDEAHNLKTPLDNNKFSPGDWGMYILTSPVDEMLQSTPYLRDLYFAAHTGRGEIKKAQIPMQKIMSEFATSANAIYEVLTLQRNLKTLTKAQYKSLLYSMSIIAIPVPVNGGFKLAQYYADSKSRFEAEPLADKLQAEIQDFKKENPSAKEAIQELNHLDAQLKPTLPTVPEGTYDMIKKIESDGKWDKYDPATGAAGMYQFTEAQWKEIQSQAPELQLTDNGRVSKDPAQQEKAMKWQTENNARQLQSKELPVDEETLYAAHLLGVNDAVKLYEQAGDTKTKSVLKSNNPEITNFKTIGQVRKFIKSQVSANKLTLAGKTKED